MNNKWIFITLVLICLVITSGCSVKPSDNNDQSEISKTESTQPTESNSISESDADTESTSSDESKNEVSDMPEDYLDRIDNGWSVPTNADLLGTAWGWDDYQDDLGYRSKLIAFDEWTADVIWHDGIDENAHTYPDASYELRNENGVAVLDIDFREMAGKLSYYLLISPERDAIYTLEIIPNGNIDSKPESAVLNKKNNANPLELIGKWDRFKTAVEGYEEETEPNKCIIEIKGDSEDSLKISYTSYEFPKKCYSDKEMLFTLGALPVYTDCGNDVWYADVNYVGEYDTTFAITLLADGTLLLQNYFTIDGAPMVSYEWFNRVS